MWRRDEGRRIVLCLLVLAGSGCGDKPPTPTRAEQVRLADEALREERYLEAAAAYGQAAANGPPDGILLKKQAQALASAWEFWRATSPARQAADLLPDDVEAQLLAATVLLRRKAFDEVEERMDAFLTRHPDNVDALIALASAQARLTSSTAALAGFVRARDEQDFEDLRITFREGATSWGDSQAEHSFRDALRISPHHAESQLAMGNFLLAAGRAAEAAAMLEGMTAKNPRRARANHVLGVYYLQRGKAVEAERYLRRAIQDEYGERTLVILSLASLYLDTRREEEARGLLATVPSEHEDRDVSIRLARLEVRTNLRDRAAARLDRILVQTPTAAEAAVLKAQILLSDGVRDQAIALARSAVAVAPRLAEARSTLGEALWLFGDLEGAFDEYAEAVRLKAGAAAHVTGLTRLALALGRPREALAYGRDAARLDPVNPLALSLPARAFILMGDYEAADRELAALLQRTPASPDLFTLFGSVQAAQGNDGAAKSAFARALALAPESPDAMAGMALLDVRNGADSGVRGRLEAAIEAHPHDPRYFRAAAQVYTAVSDQARADQMLLQALALDRADLASAKALLTPTFTSQHPDTAERVLKSLLDVRPRALEARYRLGQLYEQTGRSAAAAEQYRALLAARPHPDDAAIRSRAADRVRALESVVTR